MVERLLALLAVVPNPFTQVRVGTAWETVPDDVESINALPFARCRELVEGARRSEHSHGLLVTGVAGTGKTHLLARVRHWMVENESGCFVYIPPVTAPDRFHRHVLQFLAADLLRTARQGIAATQLETAVARHFMANDGGTVEETAQWWKRVRVEHPPGPALHAFLRRVFDPVTEALALDGPVMRVLACHLGGVHRLAARDWLLGLALPEEDLRELGVAVTLDEEETARRALFTLLRLAAPRMVVLLAFDQIEGLRLSPDDVDPLRAFGLGVRDLLDHTSNLLVVTCAQASFRQPLADALGSALFDGGLAEREESLQPLNAEQTVALVQHRLQCCTDLQVVRAAVREAGEATAASPTWPLAEDQIALLGRPNKPARDVLIECRSLYEQRRAGLPAPAGATPVRREPEPTLADALASAVGAQTSSPDQLDEGVYGDGLLRAMQILKPDRRAVNADSIALRRDVNLVVGTGSDSTAISVCNAANMRSLAARLQRLQTLQTARLFRRLVIVRDSRLPIPPTARATNERLAHLRQAGAVLVRPPAEAYAALAAVRKLLADAAAGDLTLGARAVGVEELKDWLAQNMPAPVRDLTAEVLGAAGEEQAPALGSLQALLQDEGVLELDSAARLADVSVDAARQAAALHPDLIGLIAGPPEVLYLRPEGLQRV